VASSLWAIGKVYETQGDRPQALQSYKDAIGSLEKAADPGHPQLVEWKRHLAEFAGDAGRKEMPAVQAPVVEATPKRTETETTILELRENPARTAVPGGPFELEAAAHLVSAALLLIDHGRAEDGRRLLQEALACLNRVGAGANSEVVALVRRMATLRPG
jgi:hypothetical protein